MGNALGRSQTLRLGHDGVFPKKAPVEMKNTILCQSQAARIYHIKAAETKGMGLK
jgi:hypothetical protein